MVLHDSLKRRHTTDQHLSLDFDLCLLTVFAATAELRGIKEGLGYEGEPSKVFQMMEWSMKEGGKKKKGMFNDFPFLNMNLLSFW